MAIPAFAAIVVASNELALKIFEVSKNKGITQLTHVRHKLLLGAQTYATGSISYTTLLEICNVLKDFQRIMDEFQVTSYNACATSSIRESDNSLVVLDQIKVQTGLKVRLLSNSEQRFLRYKAIALKDPFFEESIEKGTLIIDAGAGSIQFSLFDNGVLVSTQNLPIGFARIQEFLGTMETDSSNYIELIEEYMEKDLISFHKFHLADYKIKNIIVAGERIQALKSVIEQSDDSFDGFISKKSYYPLMSFTKTEKSFLAPAVLCKKLLHLTNADSIYLSDIDLCDGMVADHAEKKLKILSSHNFSEDIIAAAKNIATKYYADTNHTDNVQTIALEIFDRIRKLHGLGKRERQLLQIAVILHSCGAFVNLTQTRENSYKIIMSTEIIGLSHRERVLIANVVRYNTARFPDYTQLTGEIDMDNYITAVKLSTILKLANVLDISNRHKIKNVRLTIKDDALIIVADTLADITLEKSMFDYVCPAFEEVFGIRPILKPKRRVRQNGKI